MRKSSLLILGALLLTSCGGPQTAQYGTATLTYDSSVWAMFSNDIGSGLAVKDDSSCWIDLAADHAHTKARSTEVLSSAMDGDLTVYFAAEDSTPQYVSFPVGDETIYGRVSSENSAACLANFGTLAATGLGA